jgi:hypothetical protein
MTRNDVLIIGAGPTGLVLALWLTKLHVNVRIIDKTAEPGTTSRALAVQARTLELYRQLDLARVYVRKAGSAELHFESLPAPSLEEVQDVSRRTAERVETLLERTGRFSDVERAADEALDPLSADQPVLASCYQAAAAGRELLGPRAGQPTLRLVERGQSAARSGSAGLCGEVRGVNVHAGSAIDSRDRKRLQRLCRYIARPAISQECCRMAACTTR